MHDEPEPPAIERGRSIVETLQTLIEAARSMIARSRLLLMSLDAPPTSDERSNRQDGD
jgi:hypothetical protein